jgi:hypothetical protein
MRIFGGKPDILKAIRKQYQTFLYQNAAKGIAIALPQWRREIRSRVRKSLSKSLSKSLKGETACLDGFSVSESRGRRTASPRFQRRRLAA